MKRVLGFVAGLLLLLSPIGLHADPRNIVVDDAVVSSSAPLPVFNSALTDATDADTGLYIKPATGAIFTITGDVGTDTGVDIVSSVLPTGASTSANQIIGNAYLYKLSEAVGADTRIDVDVISMPAISATLTDAVIYDTQMEQFKFTGDDLKIEDVTLTDTTIQAVDLDIRDLTSASDSVDVPGVSTSANQVTGNAYLYKLSESVDTDTRVKTNANLQVGDADVSETNSVPTHEATGNWWTEYRYDVDDKVTVDSGVTITKSSSSGHEYIATGYSLGSWGCGHGDWQLKVDGSTVAVGGFGPDDGSQGAYKFPIPIKAGNDESIVLVVTPREADALIICTLYGYE